MNDQFQFVFRLTMAVNLVLQPNVTIDDFKALVAAEGRTDINIQGKRFFTVSKLNTFKISQKLLHPRFFLKTSS